MTKDYLGDRRASEQLAWRIRSYWNKKGIKCHAWVEPFYIGTARLWQVRSDLKFKYK